MRIIRLITCFIIGLLLTACDTRVLHYEIKEAERVCSKHEGVLYLVPTISQGWVGDVRCMDGLTISEHRISVGVKGDNNGRN